MREILYVDPVAGVSGDMFLGALVDLGADFDELQKALASLAVPGFALKRYTTFRHEVAATKVDVVVADEQQPHRHLGDLLRIIDASTLPDSVKETSGLVLRTLVHAESRVHRMPVEQVHLHEVGGLDCLVDIVGTVFGLHLLGIDEIYSGPVTLGTGVAPCAHGNMPVPVPGVMAMLPGFPIRKTNLDGEMTTPTGAALLTSLACGVVAPFVMIPRKVGYGAGTRDVRGVANVLRLVVADVDPKMLPPHYHADDDPHEHGQEHDHEHGHGHPHGHEHAHGHHHH